MAIGNTAAPGAQSPSAITAAGGRAARAGAAASAGRAGSGGRAGASALSGAGAAGPAAASAGDSAAVSGVADAGWPQAGDPAAGVGGVASPVAGMFAAAGALGADLSQAGGWGPVSGGTTGARAPSNAQGLPSACDRTCLLGVMQSYLDALIAHDPSTLALSPALKMTDNGLPATPGDGLWQTATALDPVARLDFADPIMRNVATQCLIREGTTPVLYQVRLKVDAGQISEIESVTVRQADAANGFFDPTNLAPQPVFTQPPDSAARMTRDRLTELQYTYLDYLEGTKSGSQVPFDADCARYENGVITASGTLFQMQHWSFQLTRRVLIIDEEAGITFGMFPYQQGDPALVVGTALKMQGGAIMMIQAIMAYMPSSAWD